MDITHFHGNHHLGDTLISFIVLYNIKDFFEKNNKTVYFYMRSEHIDQMKDFIPIKGMIEKPRPAITACFTASFEVNSIFL
jgi:hypothetical protein